MTKNQWIAKEVRIIRHNRPAMRISRAQQIAKRDFVDRGIKTDYYDRLRLLNNRPWREFLPVFGQQLFGETTAVMIYKLKHRYEK